MRATVGDIEVEYVLTGPEDGTPIVLVCGLWQSLTLWPSVFTTALAAAGFRVLTFDNRDAGRSSYETRPAPDLAAVSRGDLSGVNYTLSDMAADVVGLMRAIGWETAHVLGHSMGAEIAQRLAIEHPEAVRTLTLFASKPLDGSHGRQAPEFLDCLLAPMPTDEAAWVEHNMATYRICIAPEPVDESALEAFTREQFLYGANPASQHLPAVLATTRLGLGTDPTHQELLTQLSTPTLMVHGTGDRVVFPDGGVRLAELIPAATLVTIDGMGHQPQDPERWQAIAEAVISHADC